MPKLLVEYWQFVPNYALGDLLTLCEQLLCKRWCFGWVGLLYCSPSSPQTALQYKQFTQNPWGMRLLSKSNIKLDITCCPSPVPSNLYFISYVSARHFFDAACKGKHLIFTFFLLLIWFRNEDEVDWKIPKGKELTGQNKLPQSISGYRVLLNFAAFFSSLSSKPHQCSALSWGNLGSMSVKRKVVANVMFGILTIHTQRVLLNSHICPRSLDY